MKKFWKHWGWGAYLHGIDVGAEISVLRFYGVGPVSRRVLMSLMRNPYWLPQRRIAFRRGLKGIVDLDLHYTKYYRDGIDPGTGCAQGSEPGPKKLSEQLRERLNPDKWLNDGGTRFLVQSMSHREAGDALDTDGPECRDRARRVLGSR